MKDIYAIILNVIGIIITVLWIQDPGFLTWHFYVLIPLVYFATYDTIKTLKARRKKRLDDELEDLMNES